MISASEAKALIDNPMAKWEIYKDKILSIIEKMIFAAIVDNNHPYGKTGFNLNFSKFMEILEIHGIIIDEKILKIGIVSELKNKNYSIGTTAPPNQKITINDIDFISISWDVQGI